MTPLPDAPLPEPWLRGPIPGLNPCIAPILYAFEQAREDLASYTAGLTADQIWAAPCNLPSIGFHIRHIARSVDRLMTYLSGAQLSEEQMAALATESHPGEPGEALLGELDSAFRRAEAIVRALPFDALAQPREVGRKRLPTTVIGLLTHIAEHTQRHVGQAITTAKLVKSMT
jgi:uncharacterized damage-inducible protein DinB